METWNRGGDPLIVITGSRRTAWNGSDQLNHQHLVVVVGIKEPADSMAGPMTEGDSFLLVAVRVRHRFEKNLAH